VAWTLCFAAVAFLGLTALAVEVQTSTMSGLFFSILITVGLGTSMWAWFGKRPLRSAIPGALTGAVVWMLAVGLTELIGPWGFVVMALVLLSAPRTVALVVRLAGDAVSESDLRLLARHRVRPGADPARAAQTARDVPDMASMSLPALCGFWRDSSAELASRPDRCRWLLLVRMREACLDQLHDRDEDGYERWMAAGPLVRAPSKFLGD
jgi:hypothetical protein